MESIRTDKNNKEGENQQKYGLMELEEMLKNIIKPPGIMEYDDMPPEVALEASQSTITKAKKVKKYFNILFFLLII